MGFESGNGPKVGDQREKANGKIGVRQLVPVDQGYEPDSNDGSRRRNNSNMVNAVTLGYGLSISCVLVQYICTLCTPTRVILG